MNRRMMGQEKSLNEPIKDGEKGEWQDWIVSEDLDQELFVAQQQEMNFTGQKIIKRTKNIRRIE